jgi:hypothetical protein
MCYRITTSSRRDINLLGFCGHLVREAGAEGRESLEVNAAAEELGEFELHPGQPDEAGDVVGVKLDEEVEVALVGEIIPQRGAE